MPKHRLCIVANAEVEARRAVGSLQQLLDHDFTLPEVVKVAKDLRMSLCGTDRDTLARELPEKYERYQSRLLDELVFLNRYHSRVVPMEVKEELRQYQQLVSMNRLSSLERIEQDFKAQHWLSVLPDLVLRSFFGSAKTPELWSLALLALLCRKWQMDIQSPQPPKIPPAA